MLLERIAEDIQSRFPNGTVTLSVKDSYENMKPYIDRVPAVMEHVRAAYRAAGLEPIEEQTVRGSPSWGSLAPMSSRGASTITASMNACP